MNPNSPSLESPRPTHRVLAHAAAAPDAAAAHFAAKLAFETDASDVHVALTAGDGGFVVVDARSRTAYAEAHIPGALSFPQTEMTRETTRDLDPDVVYVCYCWSAGCNGSTRAALKLSALGFRVKELIGGLDCWQKEGYRVESGAPVLAAAMGGRS